MIASRGTNGSGATNSPRPLKIFADKEFLPPGRPHVPMLYPFWGKNPEDISDPTSGRFDELAMTGDALFEMSSLSQSDVVVLPVGWEHVSGDATATALARRLNALAAGSGKKTAVFCGSDSDEQIDLRDALVFRTSAYRSTQRVREFAMPAWSEDFESRYLSGDPVLRIKRDKPVVSFCGFSAPIDDGFKQLLKRGVRNNTARLGLRQAANPGLALRQRALRALTHDARVETNFLIRDQFLGGALATPEQQNKLQKVRAEYVDNIVDSDYVLCVRGQGNFSYRLYEALSAGRIPLFVNTDCVLPYDFEIDWKSHMVWVEEREIPKIGDRLTRFHSNISPGAFLNLQRRCRTLWEERIRPVGFFTHFASHLHLSRASVE